MGLRNVAHLYITNTHTSMLTVCLVKMKWWRALSQCQNMSFTKPLLQVKERATCNQFSLWHDGYPITKDFSFIHVMCGQHNSTTWCKILIAIKLCIHYIENYSILPYFCVDKKSHICLRANGSTPAVGSSRIIVRDPPTNASKIDNFRFMPPDKCLARIFLNTVRLTFWSQLLKT